MSATATNDRPSRKQLADQLDRLDTILDALADALQAAVADACREGARQAVRDAVVEILTSPEIRTLMTGLAAARVAPPPASAGQPADVGPAKPRLWTRLGAKISAARDAAAGRIKAATTAVAATARTLAAVMPVRKILLVGAGVGLAVGTASYLCPHDVPAVVSGAGGACTAVAAQIGAWVRRSTAAFGLAAKS